MNDKKDCTYQMTDFYITAYLLCSGCQLLGIKRQQAKKQKCVFVLRSEEDIETLIKDYYNDNAQVNPKAFKTKIQDLKAMIYSGFVGGG